MEDRQAILTTLHRRFLDAESGGMACVVSGAAGAGKTHLAEHFLADLPVSVARLRGRGLRTGVAPLLPVCEALRTCSRGTNTAKFRAIAESYIESVPYVKEALGPLVRAHRRTAHGRVEPGGGLPSETHAFFVLAQLIESLSGDDPAVLFIDDVQWADPSSIGFIGYLASQLRDRRVFVLLTRRLNGHSEEMVTALLDGLRRDGGDRTLEVSLSGLTHAEIRAFAESVVGRIDLTESDLDWLDASTQGRPYYLNELLTLLRDQGVLRSMGRVWQLRERPVDPVVPPSLQAYVRDRVLRATHASDLAREAVQFGACLGLTFDLRVVAEALGQATRRVAGALADVLASTNLVRRLGSTTVFMFDHELTREAILTDLGDFSEEIHGRLAIVLAAKVDTDPASVAYHFAAAGDARLGAQWYLDAGERAARAGLYDSSLRYGHLARDLIGEDPSMPGDSVQRTALVIGGALVGAERYADAVAELSSPEPGGEVAPGVRHLRGRAGTRLPDVASRQHAASDLRLALEEVPSDAHAKRAAVLCDLVHAYDSIGDYPASQTAFRAAVVAAKLAGEAAALVRALRLTCMFWQPEKVCEALAEALAVARKSKLRIEEAFTENNLGTAYFALRQLHESRKHFDRAQSLLKSLGGHRCDVPMNNVGLVCLAEGDVTQARSHLQEAMSHSNDVHNAIFIRSNLAIVELIEGKLDSAVAQLQDLAVDADKVGDAFYQGCVLHNLAEALLRAGSVREAGVVATRCRLHHHGGDDALIQAKHAALVTRCLRATGTVVPADLLAEAAVLERTTKPQAWLYREPWYLCDIEFWED